MRKVHLVIIDPQNDFMDLPNSALPVAGANDDMNRLASFIRANIKKFADIHVTLDSHQVVDIAHPAWWRNSDGSMVSPFTMIKSDDIEAGIFTTRDQRLYKRSLEYARQLEKNGKYNLLIWPPHCRIGTWGHNVQENLMEALTAWSISENALIDFVTKGSNPFTEHYGALEAEVPIASDTTTQLNTDFIKMLQEADEIIIAGEASSHCVKATVDQIADNIGDEHIKKIHILTDATSPVAAVRDGNGNLLSPDFPAIAKQWMNDMEKRGVTLTTTTTFFN